MGYLAPLRLCRRFCALAFIIRAARATWRFPWSLPFFLALFDVPSIRPPSVATLERGAATGRAPQRSGLASSDTTGDHNTTPPVGCQHPLLHRGCMVESRT